MGRLLDCNKKLFILLAKYGRVRLFFKITITMASNYSDPRDFVMHISAPIIAEYLSKRHSVNFPLGKKDESREECADRFIDFIHKQNERLQDEVFMELEYINSLSSENHIKALCDTFSEIDREDVIEKDSTTYDERALRAFTHYPQQFDEYYGKANIEELGVKELTLPKVVPISEITVAKINSFQEKVQGVYKKSLKGEKCKIKTFPDADKLILRAYLEDLPTRDTVFDGKNLDEKHIRKPVFDVVFVYTPELKVLGVRALGGKDIIQALQKLFCAHFLGIPNVNTAEPRYFLTSVQNLTNLKLVPDATYGVERAYLKSIRLKNKGVPHKLYIDVGGREKYSGADAIQTILKELNLDRSTGWEAESIKITVVFKQTGKGRRKQVTVTVTPPSTCDLKNRKQDDIVRKLLKDWGIFIA